MSPSSLVRDVLVAAVTADDGADTLLLEVDVAIEETEEADSTMLDGGAAISVPLDGSCCVEALAVSGLISVVADTGAVADDEFGGVSVIINRSGSIHGLCSSQIKGL